MNVLPLNALSTKKHLLYSILGIALANYGLSEWRSGKIEISISAGHL
jgi:hypothetical protein